MTYQPDGTLYKLFNGLIDEVRAVQHGAVARRNHVPPGSDDTDRQAVLRLGRDPNRDWDPGRRTHKEMIASVTSGDRELRHWLWPRQ